MSLTIQKTEILFQEPIIGTHLSRTAGKYGYSKTFKLARELGLNTFQIFAGNPRTIVPPKLPDPEDIAAVQRIRTEWQFVGPVIHAPYVLSLSKAKMTSVVRAHILRALEISDLIGGLGFVIHPGSHEKFDIAHLESNIADLVAEMKSRDIRSRLILENQAQTKNAKKLMSTLEDFKSQGHIIKKYHKHVAFCYDTCHHFVSESTCGGVASVSDVLHYIPAEFWAAIHFNDAEVATADRHAAPGHGLIDPGEMKKVFALASRHSIPLILELGQRKKEFYEDLIKRYN